LTSRSLATSYSTSSSESGSSRNFATSSAGTFSSGTQDFGLFSSPQTQRKTTSPLTVFSSRTSTIVSTSRWRRLKNRLFWEQNLTKTYKNIKLERKNYYFLYKINDLFLEILISFYDSRSFRSIGDYLRGRFSFWCFSCWRRSDYFLSVGFSWLSFFCRHDFFFFLVFWEFNKYYIFSNKNHEYSSEITSLCRFNPRDDIGYSIFLGLAPTRGARSFSGAKSHNGSSDMKIQVWCGNTLGKLLFQLELLAQIYPTTRLIHSSFFIRIIYYSRLFEHHPHFFTGESNW